MWKLGWRGHLLFRAFCVRDTKRPEAQAQAQTLQGQCAPARLALRILTLIQCVVPRPCLGWMGVSQGVL